VVSLRLNESLGGMGGTLISDECHLFNMGITKNQKKYVNNSANFP